MLKALKIVIPALALVISSTTFAATVPAAVPASSLTAVKIGVIDMQQIMQQSAQAVSLNKQLQTQFQPRQQKLVTAQKNLQAEMSTFNKNGPTLNDADRTKTQNQILADRTSFQQMVQSYQQDLSTAQNQAMQKFMGNVQNAVSDVAKQGNYTLIVQRAAAPYADPSLDITKQVIADMSK
jgi:outer membrane protein